VKRVVLAVPCVLVIIYVVPFVVYGTFTIVADFKPPEGVSPTQFLISVLVSKTGTAIAFVLIYFFARTSLGGRWVLYASLWWMMFVLGEIGQATGPNYTWKEAIAGIISETAYFPLSAYITSRLVGPK
jgi:hypothetical protein